MITFLKKLRHKLYIAFYRLLPVQRNKILCFSNNLKAYGCNPKYITEYLCENLPGVYDIVWVFNEATPIPADLPAGVRTVQYFSLAYLKELHTARVIITNTRMGSSLYWHKRKGQQYLQTWHSSLRLKKIEGDADLPTSYVAAAKADSANIDLLISGCAFSTEIFQRAFWYDGPILPSGTPRFDVLLRDNPANKEKVCAALGISPDSRIALYAPTFRKDYAANDLGLDYTALQQVLEKKFGGQWTVIYRYHPNVRLDGTQTETHRLKNGSRYNDMQELLAASDLLVTDYSSCMFDAAIKGMPCLLYVPDIDDYRQNERGLYFDLDDLPFPQASSNGELATAIAAFDTAKYQNACRVFLDSVGSYEDGHAAERIAAEIEKICS